MMLSTITVTRLASARIPTDVGEFQLAAFSNNYDQKEHLAVIMGDVSAGSEILVRVHSECFTGDVLGSRRCDCGEQLQRALELIAAEGRGVLLYLRQEGRGIGLAEKLRAYNLQDQGLDTVDANLALGHAADERDYTAAALMLRELGIESIKLITNNPTKIEGLTALGITVSQRVPSVATQLTQENLTYLRTKAARMRHLLNFNGLANNGHAAPAANGNGHAPATPEAEPDTASPLELLHGASRWAARHRRPLVTLSYAQSLDGAITAQRGRPTPISGAAALKLTHRLRAAHDGILVGIETALSDDPRLTARLSDLNGHGPQPRPVLLDSRLRLPLTARILQEPPFPIVATVAGVDLARLDALRRAGAVVVELPADDQGRVSLPDLLAYLYDQGLHSLMVEGGAAVIQGFLRAQLADQAVITISLRLMGGYHVLNGSQPGMQLARPRQMRLDDDLIVWGKLKSAV